jgi:hypothetical protein
MADNAKTSKAVAGKASKILKSKGEGPTCKSVAGSALSQAPYKKPRKYYGE